LALTGVRVTWLFATITDVLMSTLPTTGFIVPSSEDGCPIALWCRMVNLDCEQKSSIRRLVQEPTGAEEIAVFDNDDTREIAVAKVGLDEKPTLDTVKEVVIELELEILLLLDEVAILGGELVTATIDDDWELEVIEPLTGVDWLLAQINWVEPISHVPGVNPPKTI
jgi:hypothetical protein